MSEKNNEYIPYLSDEELFDLIEDTEKNMTIAAPPDLAENLIERITAFENRKERDRRQNIVEYRRFCIRVSVAVAAAIAIICISPFISPGLRLSENGPFISMHQDNAGMTLTRADVIGEEKIPSREEVVKDDIPTKEAVMGRNEITDSIRGSHRISDAYNRNAGQ